MPHIYFYLCLVKVGKTDREGLRVREEVVGVEAGGVESLKSKAYCREGQRQENKQYRICSLEQHSRLHYYNNFFQKSILKGLKILQTTLKEKLRRFFSICQINKSSQIGPSTNYQENLRGPPSEPPIPFSTTSAFLPQLASTKTVLCILRWIFTNISTYNYGNH